MPKGVYERSEVQKQRLRSLWNGEKHALGYKFTPEQIKARYSHPVWRSQEFRDKISKVSKGHPVSPETRAKISKGHAGKTYGPRGPLSDSHKLAISIANRRPEAQAKRIAAVKSEAVREKIRAARARQVLPVKDSKPEVIVQEYLTSRGIAFEKHKTLAILEGSVRRHQFDLMLSQFNLVIEVDGCFWHGCDSCGLKSPMNGKNKERDTRIDSAIRLTEWTIARIWEHDVNDRNFSSIDIVLNNKQHKENQQHG